MVEQNKLLLNRFESLSAQVSRVQKQRAPGTPVRGTPNRATTSPALVSVPDTPTPAVGAGSTQETDVDDGSGVQQAAGLVDDAAEDMREIIKFLRNEKELVDAQLESKIQESRRLQQKLDHTTAELDDVRVQLAAEREMSVNAPKQAAEYDELLKKVNDINILRESNSTLREESKRISAKAKGLEETIESLKAKIQPLEDKLANTSAEVEAKQARIKILEEDNERWKNRTQQILHKYEVSILSKKLKSISLGNSLILYLLAC